MKCMVEIFKIFWFYQPHYWKNYDIISYTLLLKKHLSSIAQSLVIGRYFPKDQIDLNFKVENKQGY